MSEWWFISQRSKRTHLWVGPNSEVACGLTIRHDGVQAYQNGSPYDRCSRCEIVDRYAPVGEFLVPEEPRNV